MPSTKAQIVDKAAARLGLKTGTLNLSSSIEDSLGKAYDEIWAMLDAINLVDWDSSESVPDEYVSAMVDLVAFERADDYAISSERYQRIAARVSTAESRIRQILNPYTYKATKTVNY